MTTPRFGVGDGGPGAELPGPPSSAQPSGPGDSGPPAGSISPDPPTELVESARRVFGDRLAVATSYARLLVTDGVVRGLIGPREAPRIWERHLINCAVLADLIPIGAYVVDVGSGAGLPGIVLAVARPDLTITLVEPLARRTAFLSEAVTTLGLDATVTVVRGRAEEVAGGPPVAADVVTARAVAPLDRLAGWCLPLAAVGGRLLALKGASAAEEVAEHREVIHRLGGSDPVIRSCGAGVIDPPSTVVEIVRERDVVPPRSRSSARATGTGRPTRGGGERGSGQGRTRRR
ncbi:16S rRNA (guanine(527)-N(7))-methyltransferase RsmG [Krasilnikovia sp. MM14-A1259]|uniref:16S rRNA (guanine(527)-N(7))-methyltransferase RsmG n=1 Tax=Krasilnikovia sp. MM14-A1259 TaxID=3373539 RepID=UPI0037F8C210